LTHTLFIEIYGIDGVDRIDMNFNATPTSRRTLSFASISLVAAAMTTSPWIKTAKWTAPSPPADGRERHRGGQPAL